MRSKLIPITVSVTIDVDDNNYIIVYGNDEDGISKAHFVTASGYTIDFTKQAIEFDLFNDIDFSYIAYAQKHNI